MKLTGKQIGALAEMVGFNITEPSREYEDDMVLDAEMIITNHEGKTIAYWKDYPEEGYVDLDDF